MGDRRWGIEVGLGRGHTRNDHVGREGARAGRAARVIVDLQSEETHILECCREEGE